MLVLLLYRYTQRCTRCRRDDFEHSKPFPSVKFIFLLKFKQFHIFCNALFHIQNILSWHSFLRCQFHFCTNSTSFHPNRGVLIKYAFKRACYQCLPSTGGYNKTLFFQPSHMIFIQIDEQWNAFFRRENFCHRTAFWTSAQCQGIYKIILIPYFQETQGIFKTTTNNDDSAMLKNEKELVECFYLWTATMMEKFSCFLWSCCPYVPG